MLKVSFRKVDVDGFNIFYREAGSKKRAGDPAATRFPERRPYVP